MCHQKYQCNNSPVEKEQKQEQPWTTQELPHCTLCWPIETGKETLQKGFIITSIQSATEHPFYEEMFAYVLL